MEFSQTQRQPRQTYTHSNLPTQQSIPISKTPRNHSSNSSFLHDNNFPPPFIDNQIRLKAQLLLSLPTTPRTSPPKKFPIQKQLKLSLMQSPKKKTNTPTYIDTISRNNSIKKININNNNKYSNNQFYKKRLKLNKLDNHYQYKDKQNTIEKSIDSTNILNFFSLPEYFSLVFSKLLSQRGKQKIYTFLQQLSSHYEKYPETIQQDIIDIQKISDKLKYALGTTFQLFKQLHSFQSLEINSEIARIIFNLAYELGCKKYHFNQFIHIYKQIQYCSRILTFNKLTLRICFDLGELYKINNDQLNSHAYFAKALKMAVYLNDKFSQLKAIDYFGISAYLTTKLGQAHYYHQNIGKLCNYQRQTIKDSYSNIIELNKLNIEKQARQHPETNRDQLEKQQHMKKQEFRFDGQQYIHEYDIENKQKFKTNIKLYMQSPDAREKVFKARKRLEQLVKVGTKKSYIKENKAKIWTFKGDQNCQNSAEILLTHRSLNRINPKSQLKILEKQRKILGELITYYLNDSLVSKA